MVDRFPDRDGCGRRHGAPGHSVCAGLGARGETLHRRTFQRPGAGLTAGFQYQRGAEKRAATLTTSDVFLTGPAVFPFIQRNLPQLLAGEEIDFKYGVLDRLDYYTFALSTQSKPTDEVVVVRIRATSLFVRMAIDPIYVTVSRAGKFNGIRGRTILMEPKGDGGVPIDADLVVEAETPAACASAVASRPALDGANTGPGSSR